MEHGNASGPGDVRRRLDILGIVYYVVGGVVAATAAVFLAMVPSGGYFAGAVLVAGILCLLVGGLFGLTGRLIRVRRGRMFCFIVGCLTCLAFIPIGTVLGVFTIVLLSRDDVKSLFLGDRRSADAA